MKIVRLLYLSNGQRVRIDISMFLWWALILSLGFGITTRAQQKRDHIRQARSIETVRGGVKNPQGLVFAPKANVFLVIEQRTTQEKNVGVSDVIMIDQLGNALGIVKINTSVVNPINIAFDDNASRLFMFREAENKLVEIDVRANGRPRSNSLRVVSADQFALVDPQGMTFDSLTGDLIILDSFGPRIVRIAADSMIDKKRAKFSDLDLTDTGLLGVRGIAVDPETGHFQIMTPGDKRLYEIDSDGAVVANRDLSAIELIEPQGMTYAPSGDLTDDSSQFSLYIADSGRRNQASLSTRSAAVSQQIDVSGQILEISFVQATQQESSSQGTLVQTVDTSLFSPPSPDPVGIIYLSSTDTLLISDSEVNEMPIFTGVNQFETTLVGSLLDTFSTTSFSGEPTGVTVNPANNHLFFSDDSKQKIFELDPGTDGMYGTTDDMVTSVSTLLFSPQSFDPEGVTYSLIGGESVLFIVDGTNGEVYRYSAGADGVFFNGLTPGGDDIVTNFDTFGIGITDPEGIAYETDSGHLYVIGQPPFLLAHITTSGTLLRTIDVSAANADRPAGLAYAPNSQNPLINSVYIVDRAVDNDFDPNENDGKMYEISVPPITPGNMPPTVDAGPDQLLTIPAIAVLDGTVMDDGIPPGVLSVHWTHISGPGTVTFSNPTQEDTTASFSIAGTYILRLEADDTELVARDEVTITVTGSNGEIVKAYQIAASSDDAEERATGQVDLTSTDLELVFDSGGNQTVGLRFSSLDILSQSTILNAFIQFQVDEGNTQATSLTIHGEAADNASTFIASTGNITDRPTTVAAVPWSPAPWPQPGVSGPEQRTPNIASVIQEIINQCGWESGNALSVIISGVGERTAESFDGVRAPLLHVEYLERVGEIPVVNITDPLDGSTFNVGQTVTFMGNASDIEDGDLTTSLNWTSDMDGNIGSGASFATSTLSVGTHTITASVVDSDGFTGCAFISVAINGPPTVNITSPLDNAEFGLSESITFSGTASDIEEGDVSASLNWTSDLDGNIGSGASFMVSTLSLGMHTITASVTDSGGLSGMDLISISVIAGGNLVGNPSFETDTSGWSAYSGSTFQRISGGFDGSFSLEVTGPNSLATFGINDTPNWVSSTQGVGTLYRFTAWVKSDVSTGLAHLSVREYLNGVKIGPTTKSNFVTLSPSWQMIQVDRVSQANGSTLDLQVLDDPVTPGEILHIDAVTIQLVVDDATIGDFVWNDLNGNGVQDGGGEVGLDNVTLELIDDANGNGVIDSGEGVVSAATTSGGGQYDFTGLASGDYIVNVTDTNAVLTGFTLTGGTNPFAVTGLAAGADVNDADFGYQQTSGSIGDFVWNDLNGNGVQDGGGEVGLDNVTLELIDDANGNGVIDSGEGVVSAATTSGGGQYDFTGLASGDYIVNVTDTNAVLTGFTLTGGTNPFAVTGLAAGADVNDADFGYQQTSGSIGDFVWNDLNGNGVQDGGGEVGLDNVTLELIDDANGNGVIDSGEGVVSATTTSGGGQYDFTGLASGDYIVNVTDTNAVLTGFTLTGGTNPFAVTGLVAGADVNDADFGYQQTSGSIGDFVWNDLNGNGVQDGGGEVGLDNVTLELIDDANGNGVIDSGEGVVSATTTSGGGQYDFTGLASGDYIVNVTDTNAVLTGFTLTGGTNPFAVTGLVAGADVNDADFGYQQQAVTQILERLISASSDDAEERVSNSSVQFTSTDLELVDDGTREQLVGLRFTDITIPNQSTIENAYIQFQADETNTGAISLTIEGEAIDDASTFASVAGNISLRSVTSAFVLWSPPDWTAIGEAGPDQRTPDVSSVIQEIVNRPGWSSGNSLSILIRGDGERTAESFDGVQAPLLQIEFISSGDQPPAVTITAPPDTSEFDMNDSISFVGSATDIEDGDVTASLVWTSSLTGQIGTGGSFSTSLPAGTHIITSTATDSVPQSGMDQVTIDVVDNSDNLVGNPSFEIDTSGWSAYRGSTIQRISGGSDGAFSLEVTGPNSLATFGINDSPNWVSTTPAVGVRYRFTAWVKSDVGTGFAHLSVREYLGGAKVGATTKSSFIALSPSWQMITVDRVTQASGSTFDFQVLDDPAAAGEIFQIDDISIQIIP